jgi:hypothetical protein
VNFLDDVYLYNVDDLQTIAADYLKRRQAEIAQCEAYIREKARGLLNPNGPPGLPPSSKPAFGQEYDHA